MNAPARAAFAVLAAAAALAAQDIAHAQDVTPEQVRSAIQEGRRALLAAQQGDGSWPEQHLPGGLTALAALALLNAGDAPDGDALRQSIDRVRLTPDQNTYVVALKIMVLARADPAAHRDAIADSARWLQRAQQRNGLWNYTEVQGRYDHSNTQFALLGLYEASLAGIPIAADVWREAQAALLRTQNQDGGWAYQGGGRSYGSMTAAGVADLLILARSSPALRERGFRDGVAPGCGRRRDARPLAKGLEWLDRNFQAGANPRVNEWTYYWLYTVERVGLLSGRRFFGTHDWYRAGAAVLVRTQQDSGRWSNSLTDTALALLFLTKGRKPLAAQKLQWAPDADWNPDPHDLENLIAFIDDDLGEPVGWQVVPFDAPLEEWLAAPLLYMQGHRFPEWSDEQRAKLRRFVELGGTLMCEACCGAEAFRAGFERFAAQTFADLPLRELGPTHAVHSALHAADPYGVRGIDFACRTAVIYSPRDLSCLWEQRDVPQLSEQAFKIGANIAAYAAGRRALRDRLDVIVLPTDEAPSADAEPTPGALRLAHLVYDGDWRPFPTALAGLAAALRDDLGMDIVTRPRLVRAEPHALAECPIVWLSGSVALKLSDEEVAALAAHLRRGGFLIAEACCRDEPFVASARMVLERALPASELEQLPADHPIFAGKPGFNVSRVAFTPDVLRERPGLAKPELWAVRVDGRIVAVLSPYSLSCGLAGQGFDGCWGYAPRDARRLAANVVMHALTH